MLIHFSETDYKKVKGHQTAHSISTHPLLSCLRDSLVLGLDGGRAHLLRQVNAQNLGKRTWLNGETCSCPSTTLYQISTLGKGLGTWLTKVVLPPHMR